MMSDEAQRSYGSDDDDFDVDDPYIAFRHLGQPRWAPAIKGVRWVQRDSAVAKVINELLAAKAQLPLTGSGLRIRVTRRLGEGRFGDVLLGEGADGGRVAVKIALRPTAQLGREASVLSSLHGVDGFPSLVHFEPAPRRDAPRRADNEMQAADCPLRRQPTAPCTLSYSTRTLISARHSPSQEVLVMELLGHSVHSLWQRSTHSTCFSPTTVLRLGRGVLHCLRRLHSAGYVHNDLKPANMLMGVSGSCACALPATREPRRIDYMAPTWLAHLPTRPLTPIRPPTHPHPPAHPPAHPPSHCSIHQDPRVKGTCI